MKKLGLFVCLLAMLFIGIPIVSIVPNSMQANSTLSKGEKIVDFYSFIQGSSFITRAYAISENGNLFYCDTSGTVFPVTDKATEPSMGTDGNLLSNVIQVTAISKADPTYNVMALRKDNSLYVWGDNTYGQFGNGTTSAPSNIPVLVTPNIPGKIIGIQSTYNANFLLTDQGEVYASGDGSQGLLGNGTTTSSNTFIKVNISDVVKITGERNSMYALKSDGSVYTWGAEVYDGKEHKTDVLEPTIVYKPDGTPFHQAYDISSEGIGCGWISGGSIGVAILTKEGNSANVYKVGMHSNAGAPSNILVFSRPITSESDVKNVIGAYSVADIAGLVVDGKFYTKTENPFVPQIQNIKKLMKCDWINFIVTENGDFYINGVLKNPDLGIRLDAIKSNSEVYESEEKYNDYVELTPSITSGNTITCKVEDPVGATAVPCTNFIDNKVHIPADDERAYQKYVFDYSIGKREIIIDLFKEIPQLQNYSSTNTNKITVSTSISLAVPTNQTDWNHYSATITNSANQTSDFTGGTLNAGTYTITVTDAYGNTQDFQFQVTDKPEPTAVFTPSSTDFVYKDAYTKVNGTIGRFLLQYPQGEATSTIASIQLGTTGDESHFSVDTTGALKVKGSDLNAGTYNVTVTGKDANQMDFTKTVQVVVGKADQSNYQITNNANYIFQANQEILITTTGNDSGENETYAITNGNSIAQISNTNKFQMLSAGAFTIEATIAGNANYNSKTVTKEITLSQLPTQTNPIKISSGDSFIYGNTYTPTYTGGTGSGNVSWSIENDSGTGANLSNGSIKVTGIGTFTLKVTKDGGTSYQSSTDTKVITVNKRKTIVKPKDVTRKVGETFKDNGVTYNPQPIAGDNLGTPIITSKYPTSQQAGRYTDGIQVTGLTNPNYDFDYQEGTLIINDTTLPNNGSGYYTITGTKGKNNWYISDIQISTTNKDVYDEISSDGINFQTTPITYHTDGDYPVTFYLKNSTTGIIAKGINYQVKIDQTPPTVPTLTMNELNSSKMARLINFLSFGNWMNKSAEVIMSSTDGTSGIDNYTYIETDTKGATNTKTTTTGKVTYKDDVEIGITAKACDKAGNCSNLSASETLMIDRKAPDITGVKDKSVYKYYYLPRFVNVKDHGSGLSYAEYLKDGTHAGTIQENVNEKINGIGSYQVNAIDNAGNETSISFKIVPLPDIEDIDGSDESKDIIDQVKDEYEEVKNKLSDDEKKEYEDWIKDAEEKWESERKKVIETDDKSSKVEGVGDTTFDPKTELIVDDISDQPLPLLPKNANAVYDVYLQKGTTKVEPDGSIKVYLPYTDQEDPIIYQIDANGNIIEIKAQIEGNYVTFITAELGKFAISNTAQPDNKDKPVCKLDGVEINIDTDGDGIPDVNVDLDNDCTPDINIDNTGDQIPDINIDTTGDGKPNLNLDTNGDGKADLNILLNIQWKPNATFTVNGFTYNTMTNLQPQLNIDDDGDGKPDRNIDADGNGIIDEEENKNTGGAIGSANTADSTNWNLWWILLLITTILMSIGVYKNKKHS